MILIYYFPLNGVIYWLLNCDLYFEKPLFTLDLIFEELLDGESGTRGNSSFLIIFLLTLVSLLNVTFFFVFLCLKFLDSELLIKLPCFACRISLFDEVLKVSFLSTLICFCWDYIILIIGSVVIEFLLLSK